MTTCPARLLIVDDEEALMTALCETLEAKGYAVTGCNSARLALVQLRQQRFDLLLTELTLPETDGIALLRAAQEIDRNLAGILMTRHGTVETVVQAFRGGAADYLIKPVRLDKLVPALERVLATRQGPVESAQLLEALQAAQGDLDSFSYSVSHDLRAPLRVIDGYCQMFIEEFGADVPPRGREVLEKARGGVLRMNQLLDALLRFSRVSRQPLHPRRIETPALVEAVVAGFDAQLREQNVELNIGDLPGCVADGELLEQVFTNLVSNALKFTAGRPNTRIGIGAQHANGELCYFVRDNGVGFDMRYAERLFGVFQRLHAQSEFAGTGIGLSIAQRIVRRHGGRMWAESTPQEGATFYFSLPQAVDEH
jgi:two-component system, sensor histidine kinase and response regulator